MKALAQNCLAMGQASGDRQFQPGVLTPRTIRLEPVNIADLALMDVAVVWFIGDNRRPWGRRGKGWESIAAFRPLTVSQTYITRLGGGWRRPQEYQCYPR